MINLSLPLPFPLPPPMASDSFQLCSLSPHVQPTHRYHHHPPRGSVCAGHFSTPELHPPNCNFVGHHSPRNTRIISPAHLHHANNPLDTLLDELVPSVCSLSFVSPSLLPHFETKRNETEGKRTISNDKRRKKRRRIVCRPRGTTSFSLRDTCLRTSIDFRFPSVDLSSFDRCLCSHGTPRRKGN